MNIMFLQIFLMVGTNEIFIIALIALLLFGGKKIPELMRGLGAGVKSFKDGMKEGEAPADKKPEENSAKKEDETAK